MFGYIVIIILFSGIAIFCFFGARKAHLKRQEKIVNFKGKKVICDISFFYKDGVAKEEADDFLRQVNNYFISDLKSKKAVIIKEGDADFELNFSISSMCNRFTTVLTWIILIKLKNERELIYIQSKSGGYFSSNSNFWDILAYDIANDAINKVNEQITHYRYRKEE